MSAGPERLRGETTGLLKLFAVCAVRPDVLLNRFSLIFGWNPVSVWDATLTDANEKTGLEVD